MQPDELLLQASVLGVPDIAQVAKSFVSAASELLIAYEMAPHDPVSDGLEARAVAVATRSGVSAIGDSSVDQASAWPYLLQTRMLLALQAAAREAGVTTLPVS